MRLYSASFAKIKNGQKKSELRLNDEKRQKISVGDRIVFTNSKNANEKVVTEVAYLRSYSTFKDLYEGVKDDYPRWEEKPFVDGMYQYYSHQDEQKYGALEIGINVLELFVLRDVDYALVEQVFERHKQKTLESRLDLGADVQHVGATSVKGLLSKGDLDIQVRVSVENFEPAKQKLAQVYAIAQPENWNNTFASFKDDTDEIPVGIQLTVIGSESDTIFARLRDVLTQNETAKQEFNELKKRYDGKSMDEYRKTKDQFIQKLLDKR